MQCKGGGVRMISKTETIKIINKLSSQIEVLEEKRATKLKEYEDKVNDIETKCNDEINNRTLAIKEKYDAQKMRVEEDRNNKISQIDEMLKASNNEKDRYTKVLDTINAKEEAIKALLGDRF